MSFIFREKQACQEDTETKEHEALDEKLERIWY